MDRIASFVILFLICFNVQALTAKSFIVTEITGEVILEKNADDIRPIASITKLFTTKIAVDYDLNELIQIIQSDMNVGRMRSTPLKVGSSYSRGELIELALVSSDNVAAIALGRTDPAPIDLPLDTRIVEASGLSPLNQSSARSIAEIARGLVGSNLAKTSIQPLTVMGPIVRKSTNPLLNNPKWHFHLSKTGFINASGGCLVVVFEMGGRLITVVILGSRDVPGRWSDLAEVRRMIDPAFINVSNVKSKKKSTRQKKSVV